MCICVCATCLQRPRKHATFVFEFLRTSAERSVETDVLSEFVLSSSEKTSVPAIAEVACGQK